MAANSFTSLSLDPPLVLFCVAHTSSAPGRGSSRPASSRSTSSARTTRSSRDLFAQKGADRFGQTPWHIGVSGAPVLEDAIAYLDCGFEAEYPGGDHKIIVGRVLDLDMREGAAPAPVLQGRLRADAPWRVTADALPLAVVIGQDPEAVAAIVSAAESAGGRARCLRRRPVEARRTHRPPRAHHRALPLTQSSSSHAFWRRSTRKWLVQRRQNVQRGRSNAKQISLQSRWPPVRRSACVALRGSQPMTSIWFRRALSRSSASLPVCCS